MAIDYDKLVNWPFPEIVQSYSKRDTILYALGLGLNMDPLDEAQLRFTYEENLAALPSMAVVLATPGFWVKEPETGIDWVRVLHGEQGFEIHQPLPAEATVVATNKVTEIIDKGADRGALSGAVRGDLHDAVRACGGRGRNRDHKLGGESGDPPARSGSDWRGVGGSKSVARRDPNAVRPRPL